MVKTFVSQHVWHQNNHLTDRRRRQPDENKPPTWPPWSPPAASQAATWFLFKLTLFPSGTHKWLRWPPWGHLLASSMHHEINPSIRTIIKNEPAIIVSLACLWNSEVTASKPMLKKGAEGIRRVDQTLIKKKKSRTAFPLMSEPDLPTLPFTFFTIIWETNFAINSLARWWDLQRRNPQTQSFSYLQSSVPHSYTDQKFDRIL